VLKKEKEVIILFCLVNLFIFFLDANQFFAIFSVALKEVLMQKVSRNDPCPCGSGKKYKKCCELKQTSKKLTANMVSTSAPQSSETQETSKVSSLFFKGVAAKKPSPEEPPNPIM
jgi:uncharacterized membrane protein